MRKHKAKVRRIENGIRWEFPAINICKGETLVVQRRGDVVWAWKRGRFLTALIAFKSWLKELVRERWLGLWASARTAIILIHFYSCPVGLGFVPAAR